MADHPAHNANTDTGSHAGTYAAFVKFSTAAIIHVFYVLVALVSFAFGHSAEVFLGFAGLFLGTLAILIDIRGGSRFFLSGGLLIVFALITAVNVA
jgi:hypothetical protein